MKDNIGRKGLVFGIIVLFVSIAIAPVITAVDNNTEDGYESRYNSEISPSDDYEEIITHISGHANSNWIKRRGIFRGEVEIRGKPWGGNIWLFGLRRANRGIEIYHDINPFYIHAYRFIGLVDPLNSVWGIALGNIEWS